MIKFLPLGGADEVGSSCFYLNIDGTGILLDCGIHPQKYGVEALPNFQLVEDKEIDFRPEIIPGARVGPGRTR